MKRVVGCWLLIVMLLGTMAGCGGKGASESQSSSSPRTGKVGTADAPVTVTYVCKDVDPNEEDVKKMCNAIEAGMAKEGNYIKLKILEAPTGGTYDVALPLAIKTGQMSPDIIYFQGGDQDVAAEGLLEDLTPYIANSKNVKNLMQAHSAERIKNYPYLLWLSPPKTFVPVIRTDFLNKLSSGKDLVADPTPENYKKLMQEAKDKGITKYGITNDGTLSRLDSIFNHAFGVNTTLMKVNDKWVYTKTTEYEKNKLAFYAELYKAGLLDHEYVTKKWDTMEKAFYQGDSLIIAGGAGSTINIYNNKMISTSGEDSYLTALPPAKGVSQAFTSVDVTKETRGFAINSASKVKDAAWAVLEFMAGPEGRKIDLLGIEGETYNVTDNKIVVTDKFPQWWARFWDTTYKFDPQPALAKPLYCTAATDSLDMISNKYYAADTNILVPQDLASQWDAMTKLYDEYSADIVTGKKPISVFDEFVKKWNEAGGDQFSEYIAKELK